MSNLMKNEFHCVCMLRLKFLFSFLLKDISYYCFLFHSFIFDEIFIIIFIFYSKLPCFFVCLRQLPEGWGEQNLLFIKRKEQPCILECASIACSMTGGLIGALGCGLGNGI